MTDPQSLDNSSRVDCVPNDNASRVEGVAPQPLTADLRDLDLMRRDAESAIRTCQRAWKRSLRATFGTLGAGFVHAIASDVLALLARVAVLEERLERACDWAVCSGCGAPVEESGACLTKGCDDGEMIPASDLSWALRNMRQERDETREERNELEGLLRQRDEALRRIADPRVYGMRMNEIETARDVARAALGVDGTKDTPA